MTHSSSLILVLLLSLSMPCHASGIPHYISRLWRRADRNVPEAGFYNPAAAGGSLLTQVDNTSPEGVPKGEPMNIIISGHSDPPVLVDQQVDGGLRNYFLSLGFSGECLGQNAGNAHRANLGDGNGFKNQSAVIRWNYGDPALGSCKQSIEGGNHFRYYVQNGPSGNSGAYFLETSEEKSLREGHMIVTNGYNIGRDYLVGNISGTLVPTLQLNDSVRYSGNTRAAGFVYHTEVAYTSGLLQNSSIGVNHNESITIPELGVNAIDGLVAVLLVTITERPQNSGVRYSLPPHLATSLFVLALIGVML